MNRPGEPGPGPVWIGVTAVLIAAGALHLAHGAVLYVLETFFS